MSTIKMSNVTRPVSLAISLLFCGTSFAADVEWEGWKFDYSTNDNSSGLVLTNVEFNDKKILARASMPVMRVEYLQDACGPYADIFSSSVLQRATQGAPNSVCDNQAQCTRTYTQNGEKMLEIGSNWQIGEYQLYQTYYFSENGYVDSRIYSRGLQCLVDHAHHAHWMFDFDVDDAENDVVIRADGSTPATEFNDLRSESNGWQIQDKVTGSTVSVIPADDDGTPDAFSSVDVAVRAWRFGEIGRWLLGARGEIGENYLNGESVDGADIVLWYVTHLPHSASEGPSIWHASGPRIQIEDVTTTPVDPGTPVDPPPPSGDNLLSNGNFDAGEAGWQDCGPEEATLAVLTDGASNLQITDGGCLYQEVDVTIGADYVLSCDAERTGNNWTIMELSFLDENYEALQSSVAQVSSEANSRPIASGAAPEGTARGLALLYSEDNTLFDNCEFIAGTPPIDPEEPTGPEADGGNLLINGGFEVALGSWYSCAANDLATASNDAVTGSGALALQGGGCLYQEFDAMPNTTYSMQCQARKVSGNEYTSVTLTLMDESYAALDRTELAVDSNAFAGLSATLIAPASSVRGAVTLYSESPGVFDDCVVEVATAER